MSVGIVEHSIFQYVLQYGFAILQYIAIRFLPYCCTPTRHGIVYSLINLTNDSMRNNDFKQCNMKHWIHIIEKCITIMQTSDINV